EEVLGVVDDLLEVLEEVDDGVADHGDVLVEGGSERVGDVKVPRLAEDGDHGRPRLDERLDVAVLLRLHARTTCGAESGDLGGLEDGVLDALEEAQVLGIGAGPAALDVVDADGVRTWSPTARKLCGTFGGRAMVSPFSRRTLRSSWPSIQASATPSRLCSTSVYGWECTGAT